MLLFCAEHIFAVDPNTTLSSSYFLHNNSAGDHRVHLSAPQYLRSQLGLFKSLTKQSLTIVEKKLGLAIQDDFHIVFDPEPVDHNGLTTLLPDDRIYVYTIPPEARSTISFAHDYLQLTITHELAHLVALQQRSGLFRGLSWLFGNLSRPNFLWPPWIQEGLAVWVEQFSTPSLGLTGRPHSGVIDFDIRQAAEYYQRTKKSPFNNSHLDGNHSPVGEVINPGNLRYHFGYLVMNEWIQESKVKNATPLKDFIHKSSYKFGFNFRSSFKKAGVAIDPVYRNFERKIHGTKLPATIQPTKTIDKGDSIRGPFVGNNSLNKKNITWIKNSHGKYTLVTKTNNNTVTTPWNFSRMLPLKHLQLTPYKLLVLVSKDSSYLDHFFHQNIPLVNRSLIVVSQKGDLLCRLKNTSTVSDFSVYKNKIALIKTKNSSATTALTATFTKDHCFLTNQKLLLKNTEAFERFSQIHINAYGWMLAKTISRNTMSDHLIFNNKKIHAPFPLGNPIALSKSKLLAHAYNKKHWGPIVIDLNSPQFKYQKISLKTGSMYSVPFGKNSILTNESLWEENKLTKIKLPRSSYFYASSKIKRQIKTPASKVKVEEYSALSSIRPLYWIPFFGAVNDGYVASGSTFFSDLSGKWGGLANAGYNSYVGEPFGQLSFFRKAKFLWLFNKVNLRAFYLPTLGLNDFVQKSFGSSLDFVSHWNLFRHLSLIINPGVSFEHIEIANLSEDFVGPSISVRIQSPKGEDISNPMFRLPAVKSGFTIDHSLNWLEAPIVSNKLQAHFSLFKTGFHLSADHGYTSDDNFPFSYFEVGGLDSFTGIRPSFQARGYPTRFFTGLKSFARAAFEWGFSWGNIDSGLSWNRFHLGNLDTRFIFETHTFDLFTSTKYKLGDDYFHTVGAEIDLFTQIVHYLPIKLTLGAYHGLDDTFGETRMSFILQTTLPN